MNTYLVYLHFEKMRGLLSETAFSKEKQRLIEFLEAADQDHLQEFLSQWLDGTGSA